MSKERTDELETGSDVFGFDAMRGIQAGREFYVAMCPMKIIPRLFTFSEVDLPPEVRAQRTLKETRIPAIRDYILENPKDYVFSSLTASVDGKMKFSPLPALGENGKQGRLYVSMNSRLLINDGQHRRRAIEEALKENPDLANETISVVFFNDKGLKRSQQMFADLNKHAVKPSTSLGILYDHHDDYSQFIVSLANEVDIFRNRVELEKTSISNRSTKFFTLSGISAATKLLLEGEKDISPEKRRFVKDFWNEVTRNIGHWKNLMDGKVTAGELRTNYIHAHSNLLGTLGIVGAILYKNHQDSWKKKLEVIRDLAWEKTDEMWEGRLAVQGRMQKSKIGMELAANSILTKMKISLDEKRQKYEDKKK